MMVKTLQRLPRVARLGTEVYSRIDVVKPADIAGMAVPMLKVSLDQSQADRLDPTKRYAVRILAASGTGAVWKAIAGATFHGSDQVDDETGLPVVRYLAVPAASVMGKLIRVETDCPDWLSMGIDIELYDAGAARTQR